MQQPLPMNKLLFLDVDGVLNCNADWFCPHADGLKTLDPIKCDRLAKIVKTTGARVVLSSTWRLFPDIGLPKLTEWLADRGVAIIDHTPDFSRVVGWSGKHKRGDEIKAWLQKNDTDARFVILDDTNDVLGEQLPFFVQTNMEDGLTDELADKAIAILMAE